YRTSFITDVTFRPGTGGRVVLAALGWRGGTLPSDLAYNGFYVSKSGGQAGPWTMVADAAKLAHSGSAEPALGQFPGAQTWYNEYIAVDPHNPLHVYAGMEEVYQSFNGGQTWSTIAPYFNSPLPCFSTAQGCPPTAHTDQHAVLITGHTMYTGSDGGVWRRPLSAHGQAGWVDLNATLHTTQ